MPGSNLRTVSMWAESVRRDIRYGLRLFRKDALTTAVAVLSLSLAIGACTSAFALINALVLRPLPVEDPGSLVYVVNRAPADGTANGIDPEYFSYPMFDRLRETGREHVRLFAMAYQTKEQIVVNRAGSEVEWAYPHAISGDALAVLGVRPAIGRLLTASDDEAGRLPVAVLSEAFWARRFARDPSVLGQSIAYRGTQLEIVGVATEGFDGVEPGIATDVWVPIRAVRPDQVDNPNSTWLRMWGRLRTGVGVDQAQAVLQTGAAAFRRDHLSTSARSNDIERFIQQPVDLTSAANGPSRIRERFQQPLWILGIVAMLVLLIACSNVASLLVARAASRGPEMVLRVALGARRGRLVQQVLIESALVSMVSCGLGALFAARVSPVIVEMMSTSQLPLGLDLTMDWRMLAFVGLAGCLTTVLFGILPALRAASTSPNESLKASTQRYTLGKNLFRPLVAGQIAFGFAVLSVSWLLGTSFSRLAQSGLGFSPDNIAIVSVDLNGLQREPAQALGVWQVLLDRLADLPEVQTVGASEYALFEGPRSGLDVVVPGGNEATLRPHSLLIAPGFLQTMGIPIREGRDVTWRDAQPGATRVAIVNESFARRFLPGGPTVGMHLDTARAGRIVIVGVARDARYGSLREPPPPTLYSPLVPRRYMTIQLRTPRMTGTLRPLLIGELARAHPALRLTNLTDQATLIANSVVQERLLAVLAACFSTLAVVLVAGGVYGVLSYSVGQRRREFGLRLALGETPRGVVALVLREVSVVFIVGLTIGIAGAQAASRAAVSLLYDVKPSDGQSVVMPIVGLLIVCALAAAAPAIRATRVDPVAALRNE